MIQSTTARKVFSIAYLRTKLTFRSLWSTTMFGSVAMMVVRPLYTHIGEIMNVTRFIYLGVEVHTVSHSTGFLWDHFFEKNIFAFDEKNRLLI